MLKSAPSPEATQSFNLNSDGTFTFTSKSGYSGEVTFTYAPFDGAGEGSPVTVTILADNTAPIGQMDFFSFTKGGSITVSAAQLLANDKDYDNDTITVANVGSATNGSVTNNGNGTFTFNPSVSGYTLSFGSFTYTPYDGQAYGDSVLVVFTQKDDGYNAYNDAYRVLKGTTLSKSAGEGVLANDWTTSSTALAATKISNPLNGTVILNADGSFSYTPNSGFTGTDSFQYKIKDGITATVSIKVVQLQPANDSYTSAHDQRVSGNVLSNDQATGDEPKRAELVSGPSTGSLAFTADGNFVYTPEAGATGTATFTYRITNGRETSGPVTVTITLTNTAPVANSNNYSTAQGTPLVVGEDGVLGNDTDADGDRLSAELVSGVGAAGTLDLNDDGSFTFVPADNFAGTATFTYKVKDGSAEATATASIVVSNTRADRAGSLVLGIQGSKSRRGNREWFAEERDRRRQALARSDYRFQPHARDILVVAGRQFLVHTVHRLRRDRHVHLQTPRCNRSRIQHPHGDNFRRQLPERESVADVESGSVLRHRVW